MSTELGKAYVQIMPSAKGMAKALKKELDMEIPNTGKRAGTNLASAMADSLGKAGKTLTKAITLPVAGAVAAATGLIGALGWGRLTGLDSARAKLQGLGYDMESVDRISSLVSDSIQGTVTTMAEGVSVAAGGLAAGVAEGAELERYIKLVGDAAVGANRDVGSMAMIFNRIQGMGRIMTQELNMIEDGMPGFTLAMAKSFDVPIDKFREMVTEGQVSSDQFLDVMDGFAGEMSDAFSGSWDGIVSRTKSNIGILGEIMLGGVFEQAKESLAEFLEYIRTDEVRGWFEDAGQSIGNSLSNAVESIKGAIDWWGNLDDETKQLIARLAGIAVVAGPVLLAVSKLIKIGIGAYKIFGLIKGAAGIVATAIGAISWPVVLVVGAIAGLIAIFVSLYKQNERFKEIVDNAWASIKNTIMSVIQVVSDFVMGVVGGLVDWWKENNELILESAKAVWEGIKETIMAVLEFMLPIIKTAWEGIKNNIAAAWDLITTIVETGINFIKGIVKAVMQMITGDWSGAWTTIKDTLSNLISGIKDIISGQLNLIVTIISGLLNNIRAKFNAIFEPLKNIVGTAFTAVKNAVTNGLTAVFDTLINIGTSITEWFGQLPQWFVDTWNTIIESVTTWVSDMVAKAKELGSRFVEIIVDYFTDLPYKLGFFVGQVYGTIIQWSIDMVQKAKETGTNFVTNLIDWFKQLPGRILEFITETWKSITTWATDMNTKAKETGKRFLNNIIDYFKQLPDQIYRRITNILTRVITWRNDMANKAKEMGSRFLTNVIDYFKNLPGRVFTQLTNVISRVTTWGTNLANRGRSAGRSLFNAIINEVKKLPGRILNIGKDIVRGFWNGITSMGSWIKDKVGNFFGGIVDGVKSKLKIFSPSRVFEDEIGEMVVRGFGEGIENNEKDALNPMQHMLDKVMDLSEGAEIGSGTYRLMENEIKKPTKATVASGEGFNSVKEDSTYKVLLEILKAIRLLSEAGIEWNDREIARLVRQFA